MHVDGEIYLLGCHRRLHDLHRPARRAHPWDEQGVAAFINAAAAGVLVFLLVETVEHAFEPVEHALEEVTVESGGTWGEFIGRAALFTLALGVGLLGLVYYERWMYRRRHRGAAKGRTHTRAAEHRPRRGRGVEFRPPSGLHGMSDAHHLAFLIAVGIGLHNFAEGLAIGQSASNGEISLAVLLVVGFAVHNATEGFGIVAPMAAEGEHPSWAFLARARCDRRWPDVPRDGDRPVVRERDRRHDVPRARGRFDPVRDRATAQRRLKLGHREMLMWGLFVGLVFGLGTELVLVAAGL